MTNHIRTLESNYQSVLNEMVYFQRNMAQQDALMQNLIQYFLQLENNKLKPEISGATQGDSSGSAPPFDGTTNPQSNQFLPVQEAQRMMGSYAESEVARASLMQMNEISRRAEVAGMSFDVGTNGTSSSAAPGVSNSMEPPRPSSALSRLMAVTGLLSSGNTSNGDVPIRPLSRADALARIEELQRNRPASSAGGQIRMPNSPFNADGFFLPENGPVAGTPFPTGSLSHEGLQVFTLGHLMPRSSMEDENGNWSYEPESMDVVNPSSSTLESSSSMTNDYPNASNEQVVGASERSPSAQRIRVRRTTYVPGWAVPPRVLLVEDDAVSRKLSSKFLQIFGCAIDVAVDGVGAVNKMNLEKYDLVLMVCPLLFVGKQLSYAGYRTSLCPN